MNQIKSTAIVRKDILILLKKISEITGKSVSKVLSDCFKHIISHHCLNLQPTIGSIIKYQGRSKDLYSIHYQIDDKTYEACLDLKKILKKSLSRIINETIYEVYTFINRNSKNKTTNIAFYIKFITLWTKRSISYNFIIKQKKPTSAFYILIKAQI